MKRDTIRAVTVAVLRDHYYSTGSWHPNGDRNGTGWWKCGCGVKGEPIERSLKRGHHAHIADCMAAAFNPGSTP